MIFAFDFIAWFLTWFWDLIGINTLSLRMKEERRWRRMRKKDGMEE